MATGIQQFSKYAATKRTLEVLGGSVIALGVTWIAAKLWPARIAPSQTKS